MYQITLVRILGAVLLTSVVGVTSVIVSTIPHSDVEMQIEPTEGIVLVGSPLVVKIVVTSDEPVNVFQGKMSFDPEILEVTSIDYNTSIANLWAEEPWYSNGKGTMNFAGGTTNSGGFIGKGTLVTITFKTLKRGQAAIEMEEARILRHDGLGTEVQLGTSVDAIFSISPETFRAETIVQKSVKTPEVKILADPPNTDLNGDDKKTILDISIFMVHLSTQNKRSDFDQDGDVDLKDLSILNN